MLQALGPHQYFIASLPLAYPLADGTRAPLPLQVVVLLGDHGDDKGVSLEKKLERYEDRDTKLSLTCSIHHLGRRSLRTSQSSLAMGRVF